MRDLFFLINYSFDRVDEPLEYKLTKLAGETHRSCLRAILACSGLLEEWCSVMSLGPLWKTFSEEVSQLLAKPALSLLLLEGANFSTLLFLHAELLSEVLVGLCFVLGLRVAMNEHDAR